MLHVIAKATGAEFSRELLVDVLHQHVAGLFRIFNIRLSTYSLLVPEQSVRETSFKQIVSLRGYVSNGSEYIRNFNYSCTVSEVDERIVLKQQMGMKILRYVLISFSEMH